VREGKRACPGAREALAGTLWTGLAGAGGWVGLGLDGTRAVTGVASGLHLRDDHGRACGDKRCSGRQAVCQAWGKT